MKYVVAVSGGVDSVVLLDMLVRTGEHELIVAHFDHGIRDDSAADARFVGALARSYDLPFFMKREELGVAASEALARVRRYEFLRSIANKHEAKIVTAHHQDDVIETIAINLLRGTGWRGLAVMDNNAVDRPLLHKRKSELYDYALGRSLEWVEDESNHSTLYMRNRIRRRLGDLSRASRTQVFNLYHAQLALKSLIDEEVAHYNVQSRHFFTMIDEVVAIEILRGVLASKQLALTRPRRKRLLHAIKTAKSGDTYQAGEGIEVQFTPREFIVKHPL